MIANQTQVFLELKQKTDRDVRHLGPMVQFRDTADTVVSQTDYALTFAIPISIKQLFHLHIDGKLLREGATKDFEFIEIVNGTSAKIRLNVAPSSILPIDYELSGARISSLPNALSLQGEINNIYDIIGFITPANPVFENVTIQNGYFQHFGDKDTDGSFRFGVVAGDLVIDKRVAGVWENVYNFGS